MFNFDRIDFQSIAAAAVGALIVSSACIAVTVAPVSAEQPRTVQVAAAETPAKG